MRVEALIAWAVGSGAYVEPIEIRVAGDGNRSVFARRAIAKGEVLVAVPRGLIVGHEDAAASTVGAPIQSFASLLHSRYMTLAVWLAAERVAGATRWRPYLDALPHTFPASMPDAVAALEGTRAGELLRSRARAFEDDRSLIADLVPDLARLPDEGLEWGLRIGRSRSFEVDSIGGHGLVPIADMFDHAQASEAAWSFDSDETRFEVRSTRALDAGEEIRVQYGVYDNAHWIAGYGFALENNPEDEVTLRLSDEAVIHVGTRFDARFQRAVQTAREVGHDANPRSYLALLQTAARASDARLVAGAASTCSDTAWARTCRIARDGERAVLAEIVEFTERALDALALSADGQRALADAIPADAVGADRLLRGFLLEPR